jgi:tetratricopeptide (TPR) repeat protein
MPPPLLVVVVVAVLLLSSAAEGFLERLLKRRPGGRKSQEEEEEDTAVLLENARALVEAHDFVGAEVLLQGVVSGSDVPSCASLTLLARARGNQGDLDECERLARQCLHLDATDAQANLLMAKLAARLANFEESKAWYEIALESDPDSVDACHGMARVTAALGALDDAEALYSQCREKHPDSAVVAFDLAVMSATRGDLPGSWGKFLAAKELDASMDYGQVGEIYVQLQYEFGEEVLAYAVMALEAAVAETPGKSSAWFLLGKVSEVRRDAARALECYIAALGAGPSEADEKELHLRVGLALTGTGMVNYGAIHACGLHTEEAVGHFRLALPLEGAVEALEWCEMELQEVELWGARAASTQMAPGVGSGAAPSIGTPEWAKELGGYLEVPRREIHSAQELREQCVESQAPIVITNFQDRFAPREAWSWDAMLDRFGDALVRVSVSQTGRFDGPEDGSLWGLPEGSEVLVRPPAQTMRFRDYVALMRSDAPETFYVEYLDVSQYLGEGVSEMAPLPEPAAELEELDLLLTNLWLSRGGTTAVLHYDDYCNILAQIRGTKHLTLFPPDALQRLYYTGRRKGQLSYRFPNHFERTQLADGPAVIFSSGVHLDDPDFGKHPLFRGLRPYSVTLQPGEVLWLPEFWHHEVKSYPDEEGMNLAINYWFAALTEFKEEAEMLSKGKRNHDEL